MLPPQFPYPKGCSKLTRALEPEGHEGWEDGGSHSGCRDQGGHSQALVLGLWDLD